MMDTAIIGAGLAGTSAAIHLARRKHRVLLLEAGKYPRPKVCGEFLSPEALACFAATDFVKRMQNLNPISIKSLRITSTNGSEWRSNLPMPALGISRFALDKALVDYARDLGVGVLEACRVTEIEGNLEDGFCIHCQTSEGKQSFQATSLITAHGKRSNLDKLFKRDEVKQERFIGLKQHFLCQDLKQQIDLHVFKGGYCGISPVEDGSMNVCLLVREDVFQQVSEHKISRFVDWIAEQNPHLNDFLSQASPVYPDWLSIAQVSLKTKEALEGDILLAGDAVGMIAPLAGDGMAMALHSGNLAALALDGFLSGRQNAETMKENYRRVWEKNFCQRMQLGRWIQAVMIEPKLLSPALRMLNHFPVLGEFLIKQTRDLALLESE